MRTALLRPGFLLRLLLVLVGMLLAPGGCKDDKSAPGKASTSAAGSKTDPASASPAKPNMPVTLTLDWRPEPEFGGFYQAENSGGFKSHGLQVDIHNYAGGATWPLVAQGKTDFATTAADQVLLARSQGADVVAIMAVFQTSPQAVMVHQARGFHKIDDLFSHPGTLAAENNPWRQFLLAKFPDPKVKITGVTPGIGVFMADPNYSQQCFITSEPLLARRNGGDPQTFLVAEAGFDPYVTVLITSGKTLKEKPEMVSNMVAACREGWHAYLEDPATANEMMGKLNKEMDAQTFADAAEAQKPLIDNEEARNNGLGTMTAARWRTLAQQLVDLKVIPKSPTPEECFINPK